MINLLHGKFIISQNNIQVLFEYLIQVFNDYISLRSRGKVTYTLNQEKVR